MFDSLRDKFQTVQEGISASFRGLSSTDSANQRTHKKPHVNYNAGADLLLKYQNEWSELHKLSEENAALAQAVDASIGILHNTCERSWNSVGQAALALAGVPQVLAEVQNLMVQLGDLMTAFDDVELGLAKLEDTVETQELQERQLDHRFQLALYKERRLAELEAARDTLAAEHSKRLQEHEIKLQQSLRERQATFGQAFEEDIRHYKSSGVLPGVVKTLKKETSLEEVVLEPEDNEELNAFLEEDAKENVQKSID